MDCIGDAIYELICEMTDEKRCDNCGEYVSICGNLTEVGCGMNLCDNCAATHDEECGDCNREGRDDQ